MTNKSVTIKLNILLIDHLINKKAVLNLIQKLSGFNITLSKKPEDALNESIGKNMDVIIVDTELLLRLDFRNWFMKIKSPNIIVLLIKNTEESSENIMKLIKAGADDFINRPLDSIEINHRINIHSKLKSKKDTITKLEKGLKNINEGDSGKILNMFNEMQFAYKEMDLKKRELESLDKAKSDFIKIVSHEIRTPLSGIIGFSQLLESKLPSEYHNYLISLNQSALRLQEFSDKAILISKLKTNSFNLKTEHLSVLHIIENVLSKYEGIYKEKGIHLRNNLSHRLLHADRFLCEKALTHVFDNAIRYSPNGSTILIEELYRHDRLSIMIIDEGPGFSEEVFDNLFGLFAHGEKYIDKNVGLGLYMVKLIMNYMGGSIKVSNNKEGGALVKLIFPI